jgi:cardiolipin synthase
MRAAEDKRLDFNWTLAYLISEWAIRLVMLVYVPQRRSPAAARTWLLVIFIFPWGGLILYSIFGRAYLPRRRRQLIQKVMQLVKATGEEYFQIHTVHPDLPPQFLQAITLAENLGEFPIVGGNHVELLTVYDEAIERLLADINAATHHVHLLYYIFADDQVGRQVAATLAEAVKRGVQCRVLMDSLGSKRSRRKLARDMRAAGIEVLELLRIGLFRRNRARLDLRNHRKIAVVDGRIAYVGSQNIVDAQFKKGIVYEELVARVTGPVVRELQVVFWADRYFENQETGDRSEYFPTPELTGHSPAQVLPSGPGYPQENNLRLMVSLVHNAQKRVVITTPYFIPPEPLQLALETAVQRGVEVHLIVSRLADQLLVSLAQRSYYEELLEARVQIHQYRKAFLHAKHLSIDDSVALIGSSNLDIRSFALNAEISLLVYDPKVVADLRAIQDKYLAEADLLTLEEWQRRPFLLKTFQNLSRLVDSLL